MVAAAALQGILSPSGRRTISAVTFQLLYPSVILTQVASTISVEAVRQWWALPVNSLLT